MGPYHRLQTPKIQTRELSKIQEISGLICGRTAKWGGAPSVKAYAGRLPATETGIEFETDVAPFLGSPPGKVFWRQGSAGVVDHENGDLVCIAVTITKNTHV